MKFTILFLQIVLLTTIVSCARPRRNKSKAEKSNVEDQVAEPSQKEAVRHKRGHYHTEVHSAPLHVHIIKKPKHKVKKIHIIPHEDHKEPHVTHSFEEIHENIEIPEKKIIEDKSYDVPVESHGEHELSGDESKHIFAEHKESIKVKHHHHHHHHVKTVVKKVPEPFPVEKVIHVPVEKIVHVPKPYPVERVVEKVVEVPVEKVVEKIIHVPKPYPVEKIVEKPIHIEKKVPVEIKVPFPVEKIVHVPKPYPVEKIVEKIVHVPKPYPVIKHVPFPVEVRVPVHIPKPYPYPVEKKVPYPVEVEKKVHVPVKVEVEKKVPYPVKVYVPQPLHVSPPQAPQYHYEKPQEHYSEQKGPASFDYNHDYHSQGSRVHEVQLPKPVYEDQKVDNTKNRGRYAPQQNDNLRSLSYQQLLQVQQQYQQQQQQYQQQQQANYQQQQPHRPHYHQHQQSQLQYQQEQQEQQQQNFHNQAQRYVQSSVYTQQAQQVHPQQVHHVSRQLHGAESIQQQVAILPNAPVPSRDANFHISVPDNLSQQESLIPQASQYINPSVVAQLQPTQWVQIQTFQPPPGYQ